MTRPSQPSKSRLLRLMLAAVAVSASDAAGMPLEGVQEYQGRAGRAKLWQEINVDVYPEGKYPTDASNAFLRSPYGTYLMLAAATLSAATGRSPGFGAGFPIKAVFGSPPGECVRPDRSKLFHGHGLHRLATYTAEPGNGLTGLLAAANVPLLVRLSLAHRSDDFVPGLAAMWFPENAPPGSIVMVPTLDMDISRRFFGREFVHALPTMHQPGPLYLRFVLNSSKPGGDRLSVDHLAQVDAQGQPVAEPSTNVSLRLQPPTALDKRGAGKTEDFRTYIMEMTEGQSTLFNVVTGREDGTDHKVGTISLEPSSEWKVSEGGDRRLYFPHALPGDGGAPSSGACPAGH